MASTSAFKSAEAWFTALASRLHARSSSQPAGKPSRLTTEALSKLALGLASSGIAIGLAYLTWTDFADSRRDAMARVSAAASIIEEHTRRSLLATDIVLESVTEWVEQRGVAALRSPMEWEHLRKLARRLPASGALFIMDQAGEVIAATPSDPPPRANVSDREWFRHLKEGHQALYIGRALTGRTVHSIFFPIARPVRGPAGKFSGAVQVGVEVNEIAEVFRQIDLGQDGQLGLYRVSDGAVVARQPMTGTQINESIAALPFFPAATNTQESSWIGTVRMGDRDHFLSARRVQDLPLIVVASTSKAHADAGVWSRLLWHSIVAAAIVTALAGLTFGAVRRVRRESRDHLHEVLQLNRQLALMNRAATVGELSASIAHELNQPLTGIATNGGAGLRYLARDEPDVEKASEALKNVVSEAGRAGEIIKNLRAMFKKDNQDKTYLDINKVIEEVLLLAPGELQSRDVLVDLQLNSNLPPVLADRVQLQQVFLNLIMNAIDAMASVQDRPRDLRIRSKVYESSSVLVSVEDTGAGIDPANTERIFDGFFTTKSDGMGMGLAICKSIIDAHGGRISASSGRPHGSTFHIILPSGDGR